MADPIAPKVNLPNPTLRKPVVPGLNSWAQQKQHEQPKNSTNGLGCDAHPTNRDRYDKPMPPPPPSEDSASQGSYLLQPKAYIQPAIPLSRQPSNMVNQKNRAVTDPIAPKPLFAGRKLSVHQLRKKYSQLKGKDDSTKEGLLKDEESPPVVQETSEKAAQVLGLYSVPDNSRDTPPSSAPAAAAPDAFSTSQQESEEAAGAPARQVKSSPVPTRRYLKENGLPDPVAAECSHASQQQSTDHDQRAPDERLLGRARTPANTFLLPPRIGTHSNKGEIGLVDGPGMHRVESFRGVIEEGPISNGSSGQAYTDSYADASQPSTAPIQNMGNHQPPNVYSPSDYGGVWENDPAVGHTLPPFTPMLRGHSSNADIGFRHNPTHSHHHPGPDTTRISGPHYNANRYSTYQYPTSSAGSWAPSNLRGNSFASPIAPLSALLPPRWPLDQPTNSVPSPPQSQQDFQRAGSISASLAQIDLTLHHHIDSTFGALSRTIANRDDRVIDQTIRRLDTLEDTLIKGFRDLKDEILGHKKHISSLQEDLNEVKNRESRVIDLVHGLDGKIQCLKKHIEESSCKCQQSFAEQSEHDSDRRRRSGGTSHAAHRRTESAHPIVGQGESSQQYRSGASRTSNSARVSGASSRRERSNTASSQQPTSRMSDERSNRREHFADMVAARGPVPDIKDHPAYAERHHVQEQASGYAGLDHSDMPMVLAGLPYERPSLSDGRWYQQAYGQ